LATWYYLSKISNYKRQFTFICIEPVRQNYILLKYNLMQLKKKCNEKINFIFLRKAIYKTDNIPINIFLSFSVEHSIFRKNKSDYHEVVQTISFKSLFERYKQNVDFLKIDIEGAEKFLLMSSIPKTIRVLVVEWHHQCGVPWKDFEDCIKKQGFKLLKRTLDTTELKVAYFIRESNK